MRYTKLTPNTEDVEHKQIHSCWTRLGGSTIFLFSNEPTHVKHLRCFPESFFFAGHSGTPCVSLK